MPPVKGACRVVYGNTKYLFAGADFIFAHYVLDAVIRGRVWNAPLQIWCTEISIGKEDLFE